MVTYISKLILSVKMYVTYLHNCLCKTEVLDFCVKCLKIIVYCDIYSNNFGSECYLVLFGKLWYIIIPCIF